METGGFNKHLFLVEQKILVCKISVPIIHLEMKTWGKKVGKTCQLTFLIFAYVELCTDTRVTADSQFVSEFCPLFSEQCIAIAETLKR